MSKYTYGDDPTKALNELNDEIIVLKDTSIERIVPDSNGWTVVEYPNKWVEMTKLFYIPAVSFTSVGNLFGRAIGSGDYSDVKFNFPYSLDKVQNVTITPNVIDYGGGTVEHQYWWVDQITTQNNRVSGFRTISTENRTRNLRFSITVKGFRP